MCFLRHARGFGWLDPNIPSEDSKPLPDTTPPKNRPNHGLRLHDRDGHAPLKRRLRG
jgi:hypothetical protein